jgi:hypothetical protein
LEAIHYYKLINNYPKSAFSEIVSKRDGVEDDERKQKKHNKVHN